MLIIQIALGIVLGFFLINKINQLWANRQEIGWKVLEIAIWTTYVSLGIWACFYGTAHVH